MPGPEVTVVIPTRDRWGTIRASLGGALRQAHVNLEVVIVDDGSSTPAPEGVEELADDRVSVVRNERSRGVAAARNAGISRARGKWVAFLDDDDLWSPRKLRIQVDAALSAGAYFAYSGAVVVDRRLAVLTRYDTPDPDTLTRNLLRLNVIPGGASNIVARADVLRELGGFDEDFMHLDDWDLWIRLADAGPAAACPEILVAYVQHDGNRVLRDRGELPHEFTLLRAKHRERSARHGTDFDGVDFGRWLAHAHRRAGDKRRAIGVYVRGAVRHRNAGNVVRAAGTIMGERTMQRLAPTAEQPAPAWLSLYEGVP
jgi:glycosyltransferase involved in cell wall biosynthesis